MQTYVYTARDESGAPTSGTLHAASVAEVTQTLRSNGKYPISVRLADGGDGSEAHASVNIRVPRADVIQIAQQLAIMVETGVTLSEALECIAAQAAKPNIRHLVEDLSIQVQGGNTLASAMARHPRSFPRLFVALIRASEKSGMLSKLLTRGTQYLRDEQEVVRRVKGALTYPAIMFGFALITTVFLLVFVLPRFTVIYARKGAALPLPTKLLMAVSGFLVDHWAMLLAGLALTATGVFFYVRSPSGRRVWHWVQLRIPLVGPMSRKLHLSRALRMIGTMAGAGVNLIECVATAHDLCGNVYFRQLWEDVSSQIQTGKQMSDPLSHSPLVPRAVAQMIHAGERSGRLGSVTEQVAGFAEQELKESIAELTRYIEPAMIIMMGALIGGVALALLLPIFTISRVVAH